MLNHKEVKQTYRQLKSYAATGRLYGVTRQRIHQIVKDYYNTGRFGRSLKYWGLNKCSICKKQEKIILHHKDFNNKNDSEDNLIPVCSSCHRILHNNRL